MGHTSSELFTTRERDAPTTKSFDNSNTITKYIMRYSIMLQLVATITLIFLGTAGLFAWLQYRPAPEEPNTPGRISSVSTRIST